MSEHRGSVALDGVTKRFGATVAAELRPRSGLVMADPGGDVAPA